MMSQFPLESLCRNMGHDMGQGRSRAEYGNGGLWQHPVEGLLESRVSSAPVPFFGGKRADVLTGEEHLPE